MPLFGSRDDPQVPTAGAAPQSDLPEHAMERLRELRGEGGRRPLFTSDLSGQDFYVLLSMGYIPTGLVMGSCVYHVAHQGLRQAFRTMGNNMEMGNYTQALYDARELAMERMQNEAEELGAEGIVGVQIQERNHGWGSHVIEFFAVGTAVTSLPEKPKLEEPIMVLPLAG